MVLAKLLVGQSNITLIPGIFVYVSRFFERNHVLNFDDYPLALEMLESPEPIKVFLLVSLRLLPISVKFCHSPNLMWELELTALNKGFCLGHFTIVQESSAMVVVLAAVFLTGYHQRLQPRLYGSLEGAIRTRPSIASD